MKSRTLAKTWAAAAACCAFISQANAVMLERITGTPSSSTLNITFTGSSLATYTQNLYGLGWRFYLPSFQPFPASLSSNFNFNPDRVR